MSLRTLHAFFVSAALASACTPTSELSGATGFSDNDDDDTSSSGAGNQGGSSNNGTGASTGSFEGVGAGGPEECAGEAMVAERVPLMMYVAFDKSGSMDSNNKWNNASTALKNFFADPAAADLLVGLRFFPRNGCDENACNVTACATPDVAVGALTAEGAPTDVQEAALVQAINLIDPGGGTPISAALEGAIVYGTNHIAANPDHKAIAVLVTDGEPQGCDTSIGGIANIAAGGFAEGIVTYTIGLAGSNEGDLQTIAQAGGGSSFVIGNGNTQAELLAALQQIQGEQLACEFGIPMPSNGQPLDPALVNVGFTPGGSMDEQILGNVGSLAECGTGANWYYDNPTNPTQIILCPSACDTAKADDTGTIKVTVGCTTIPG